MYTSNVILAGVPLLAQLKLLLCSESVWYKHMVSNRVNGEKNLRCYYTPAHRINHDSVDYVARPVKRQLHSADRMTGPAVVHVLLSSSSRSGKRKAQCPWNHNVGCHLATQHGYYRAFLWRIIGHNIIICEVKSVDSLWTSPIPKMYRSRPYTYTEVGVYCWNVQCGMTYACTTESGEDSQTISDNYPSRKV